MKNQPKNESITRLGFFLFGIGVSSFFYWLAGVGTLVGFLSFVALTLACLLGVKQNSADKEEEEIDRNMFLTFAIIFGLSSLAFFIWLIVDLRMRSG